MQHQLLRILTTPNTIGSRGERDPTPVTSTPATHKTWKLLAKLHCGPHRATAIVVLRHAEDDRYSR